MTTSATCTKVTNVLRSFERVESSCCEWDAAGWRARFKWLRPLMKWLKEKWKSTTMEKEQEQNHVRMNLEMNHHHHDHEKYDRVQYDQEQKLYVHTENGDLQRRWQPVDDRSACEN